MVKCQFTLLLFASFVAYTSQDAFEDHKHYKIKWNGPFLKNTPPPDDDENVIHIAGSNGDKYMCILEPDKMDFDTSATNSSSREEEEAKSPIDLLRPLLTGNYCSYKFELFWIYELCHGRFLRQYHEENAKFKAKVTQEYYLGRSKAEATNGDYHQGETILVNGVRKPYIKFNMTDGTKCDLTKNNRVANIIYVCADEPKIELYSIKEISTCEYEAIVLSPHLCKHKDFMQTDSNHEIHCYSLDGAPRRPANAIEVDEEEEKHNKEGRGRDKGRVAYLQGRTLIIDADLLLS